MKERRPPDKPYPLPDDRPSPQLEEPAIAEAYAIDRDESDALADLAAAIVNPVPLSSNPAGDAAAFVLRQQVHSLFATAQKLGVPGRVALEMVSAEGRAFLEEEIGAGYATPEEGLTALLHLEGGCVSVAEARKLFHKPKGVTRQAISEKIRARELIAYRTGGGQYVVPVWQFRPEGGLLKGLPEVQARIHARLPQADELFPFTFFLQSDPVLGGLTPLAALRAGDVAGVLQAVEGYAA